MVGYSVIKLLNVELLSIDKSKRCYLDNKSAQIILNYRKGLLYTEKDFEIKM